MAQHGAFRQPRRPARVEDQERVLRIHIRRVSHELRCGEAGLVLATEHDAPGRTWSARARDARQTLGMAGRHEDDTRLDQADAMRKLRGGEPPVLARYARAEARRREEHLQVLEAVFGQERHALSTSDTGRDERSRELLNTLLELRVSNGSTGRHALGRILDGDPARVLANTSAEQPAHGAGRGASHLGVGAIRHAPTLSDFWGCAATRDGR
jgi:hypothetical protein